jgi:hypothetical protein
VNNFRELADGIARASVEVARDGGAVQDKISSLVELALEDAFESGVAQSQETLRTLRAEIERLEYEARAVDQPAVLGLGLATVASVTPSITEQSRRLITLLDLATRVAEQVAGEALREIWWAKNTRGMVVVSAAQEDSKVSLLQAEKIEDASLWVAVASPGDMVRLRNGELELPNHFALHAEGGVVLERLYP